MKDTKEKYHQLIEKTYKELKDFQLLTVDYVYNKFYEEKRDKFLVADEVGLGKTIVAKGLIAKAFENFRPTKENPTFNVIYICSNQALARENLKKLNFTKDKEVIEDPLNRLIYLAFKKEENKALLKFDSLTPAVSLTFSSREGSQFERAIIFSLLAHYAPFYSRKNGLKWLLKGGVDLKNWDKRTNEYHLNRKDYLREETFKEFREILFATDVTSFNLPRFYKYLKEPKKISLWNALLNLCNKIDHNNHNTLNFKNEIIVYLRQLLTKVCLKYLSADLIILDEFQRYAEILGATSDGKISQAMELAQAVFELKDTKVLMLSATPFKPYTNSAEQDKGENHYTEFQRVLKFLMKEKSEDFWKNFEKDRRDFFSKIISPKDTLSDINSAIELKSNLQNVFKESIVRTERHKVSEDQNILIKSIFEKPLPVSVSDIKDFIVFDKLIQCVKQNGKFHTMSPIEYSKSSPFPLSFLDGYQLKKNLDSLKENGEIKKYLKKFKTAWISLDDINKYKALGNGKSSSKIPNAKMQWLVDLLNESKSWKWLWIPPTINYYAPRNIYPEHSDFSKTLIFSSWKMVPRAVSTILSYEAERNAMKQYESLTKEFIPYFADKEGSKKRKPTPILTFKMKAGTKISSAMSLFTLIYPSKFLTELYDPEQNINDCNTIELLIKKISTSIKGKFESLNLSRYSNEEGVSDRWYWAAPLLLDKYSNEDNLNFEKLITLLKTSKLTISNSNYASDEEITGKNEKRHIDDLLKSYQIPESIELGPIPPDLFDILALICLSSPSICFLRSVVKSLSIDYQRAFNASYSFGISKIHFFNKPENIATVKSVISGNSDSYWLSVLNYCLEGNLQSSLDEFMHLLVDSGNNLDDIQFLFTDILSLRTSTIKVDDLSTFTKGYTRKIRTHYAIDFGTQNLETDSGTGRVINIRQAFNSPYRPFILASTSIGQEGLDFHYFCGKVMHWNLPSNAIDIEQREGRINRYKGLIIRKNIVHKYLKGFEFRKNHETLWDYLFTIASIKEGVNKNKCELIPFWHIEPIDDIKIQRVVPIYPFSREIQKYHSLIDTLTFYRLTFGQPRQEELIETLQASGLSMEEIEILRKNLLIDLSPLSNANY